MPRLFRTQDGQVRVSFRLVWNDDERRVRAPIRLVAGIVVVLTLANTGRQIRPTALTGERPLATVVNTLVGGIPQAAAIVVGVVLVTVVLDRRRLMDLGIRYTRESWRRFAGGLILGCGITAVSIVIGVLLGVYEVTSIRMTGGPTVWLLLVAGTALAQLSTVVAEELFVRGYIITNVLEGVDGIPSVPRSVAATTAVGAASLVFYSSHAARGAVFGLMAGGLAVLLGVAFVLSGDLAVPIGIHFGVNVAGMLAGSAPQPATLVHVTSSATVTESLVLPDVVVAARLLGAAVSIGLLAWWYRREHGQIRVSPSVAGPLLRGTRDRDEPKD